MSPKKHVPKCVKNLSHIGYMDEYNKKAMEIYWTKGTKEFIEHVFKDPKNPDRKLSYAEMRALYG